MPDAIAYICKTCGVQSATSEVPPERCLICEDERQYVGWEGQKWTTLAEMKAAGYERRLRPVPSEWGRWRTDARPRLAIAQRARLVYASTGNFPTDRISYVDHEPLE